MTSALLGLQCVPSAFAWDAGPAACKASECSGGAGIRAGDGSKWRGNTHLWIINRGLDLLMKSGDPISIAAASKLNRPACRVQWQNGIWDADDLFVDAGTYPGSHFYNAAGIDFQGNPTSVLTYKFVIEQTNSTYPNALLAARSRLNVIGDLSTDAQCYSLGVALHYFGDMTQPMHTSNMSSASMDEKSWAGLHPVYEEYAAIKQTNYPVTNINWDRRWATLPPDGVFVETTRRSNTLIGPLLVAYNNIPQTPVCSMGFGYLYGYTGRCFRDVATVDTQIGVELQDAYQAAASFVYSLGHARLPEIVVGADKMWIVNTISTGNLNYQVQNWSGSTGLQTLPDLTAIRVTLEPDGTPWLLTSAGLLYRREAGTFVQKAGQLQDIASAPVVANPYAGDGKLGIWGIGWTAQGLSDFWVHQWNSAGDWKSRDVGQSGVRVSVDGTQTPWVLMGNGSAWKKTPLSNSWALMPDGGRGGKGSGRGILQVAHGPHSTYAIGGTPADRLGNYTLLMLSADSSYWDPVLNAGLTTGAVRVAVDNADQPYIVNAANAVYKWDNSRNSFSWIFGLAR